MFAAVFALFAGMGKGYAETVCGQCIQTCEISGTSNPLCQQCVALICYGDQCAQCQAAGGGPACCIPCGTPCGGGGCTANCGSWSGCAAGYQSRTCVATDCSTSTQYQCAAGYTGSPSSCSSGCTACTTGAWGAWSDYPAIGYGWRTRSNASCGTDIEYRCAAGWYRTNSGTAPSCAPVPYCSGCTQCPDINASNGWSPNTIYGTSAAGATAITGCYIPSGTTGISDETGTFTADNNCLHQ